MICPPPADAIDAGFRSSREADGPPWRRPNQMGCGGRLSGRSSEPVPWPVRFDPVIPPLYDLMLLVPAAFSQSTGSAALWSVPSDSLQPGRVPELRRPLHTAPLVRPTDRPSSCNTWPRLDDHRVTSRRRRVV